MNDTAIIRRHAPQTLPEKKILFVVANPGTLKGFPVGLYGEELTGPYYDFLRVGYEIDIVSPKGGPVQLDPMSDPESENTQAANDLITLGFKHHPKLGGVLSDTKSIAEVDLDRYDAVCVVGGGSPLVTFRDDKRLHDFIGRAYEAGKVLGLICHGACLLLWARTSDGTLVADGKTWTGYPDTEEEALNQAMGVKVNDYTIESEAKKLPNTTYESGPPYEPYAVRDGNLITAQQQNSSRLFTELIIEALSER